MTKKHYIAIAAILKSFNSGLVANIVIKPMAKQLAELFSTDNKNFDRARFLQACGIEQYTKCNHDVLTGGNLPKCRECNQK